MERGLCHGPNAVLFLAEIGCSQVPFVVGLPLQSLPRLRLERHLVTALQLLLLQLDLSQFHVPTCFQPDLRPLHAPHMPTLL